MYSLLMGKIIDTRKGLLDKSQQPPITSRTIDVPNNMAEARFSPILCLLTETVLLLDDGAELEATLAPVYCPVLCCRHHDVGELPSDVVCRHPHEPVV